jgi:hypothetical protein
LGEAGKTIVLNADRSITGSVSADTNRGGAKEKEVLRAMYANDNTDPQNTSHQNNISVGSEYGRRSVDGQDMLSRQENNATAVHQVQLLHTSSGISQNAIIGVPHTPAGTETRGGGSQGGTLTVTESHHDWSVVIHSNEHQNNNVHHGQIESSPGHPDGASETRADNPAKKSPSTHQQHDDIQQLTSPAEQRPYSDGNNAVGIAPPGPLLGTLAPENIVLQQFTRAASAGMHMPRHAENFSRERRALSSDNVLGDCHDGGPEDGRHVYNQVTLQSWTRAAALTPVHMPVHKSVSRSVPQGDAHDAPVRLTPVHTPVRASVHASVAPPLAQISATDFIMLQVRMCVCVRACVRACVCI